MKTEQIKSAVETWLSAYSRVRELVEELREAGDDDDKRETAQTAIQEDPLEVTVRSGWRAPGADRDARPEEFRILISTGGPASRIVGTLDAFGQPETARLEMQDWGTPWEDVSRHVAASAWTLEEWQAIEPTLLAYAREFYFGE
jgi:hypothetical protein